MQSSTVPKSSSVERDSRTAAFMDVLYVLSGRDAPGHPFHGLLTGLWDEFARDLAERLRDADFDELVRLGAAALRGTESHVAERQAAAVIVAMRNYLLEPWEGRKPAQPD